MQSSCDLLRDPSSDQHGGKDSVSLKSPWEAPAIGLLDVAGTEAKPLPLSVESLVTFGPGS